MNIAKLIIFSNIQIILRTLDQYFTFIIKSGLFTFGLAIYTKVGQVFHQICTYMMKRANFHIRATKNKGKR